jgi:UDP-N-acetylmuramate dehydrogenase
MCAGAAQGARMSGFVTGIANEPGYTVVENASLQGRNTFRVPVRTELLIDVTDAAVLPELFALPALKNNVLVIGEGSNTLFTRDWPGVALSMAATGIRTRENRGDAALMRVEAGENWHDFVLWSLAQGFAGLENLALIPGSVGAAPIQNIGAYGTEVCEFVTSIDAYDRVAGSMLRLASSECAFAYRDSIFKRDPQRYIVCAVEFLLPRARALRLDYAGVREELAAMSVEASPVTVAEAVMRLRTRKLPNPALIGNAGSFFKNPIVAAPLAATLAHDHPALPVWAAADETRKLSAAWLIESCGLKGFREGDAGVSSQHALVLVNYGKATGAQIWALAQKVRAAVNARYGVMLEPEPLII